MVGKRYTAAELEGMATIGVNQWADLKVDAGDSRVWLSRMKHLDGVAYENQVIVEVLVNGAWETIETYKG